MFKKVFNSELFQGSLDKDRYFEGWYYKFSYEDISFAFIPGISIEVGKKEAFIQFIHSNGSVEYFTFDISKFEYKENQLHIKIGDNTFTSTYIDINLPNISCKINFQEINKLEKNIYRPSIMGPFSYLRFMECYHGVVSCSHSIDGSLKLNNELYNIRDGKGYIEKDWGRSFPEAYLWLQSNSFDEDVSIMFSYAKIPFLTTSFKGYLGFLYIEGRQIVFATYNNTRIKELKVEGDNISLSLKKGNIRVEVRSSTENNSVLIAPDSGRMERKIHESIDATIELKVYERGSLIFEGRGINGGCELVNHQNLL